MKKFVAGAVLGSFCLGANAEFINGNDLWKYLNDTNYFAKGHSLGYVTGVFDATRNTWHCPPQNGGGITAGQVEDIVKQYLTNNPGMRNLPADVLISIALSQVWPCQNKSGKKS